jgi:GntR family transcriptional regulator, transcriptional repressor for pyruvate dehydrogenase complex
MTKRANGPTIMDHVTPLVNKVARATTGNTAGRLTEAMEPQATGGRGHIGARHNDRGVEDVVTRAVAGLVRQLSPGDRLPPERTLAAALKVSRTALRDRLSVLEGLGVLARKTGSGTYVRELQSGNLAIALDLAVSASRLSLDSLHSVRVGLERQAAREAARLAEPVPIAYMGKAVKLMQESAPRQPEMLDADLTFHRALFTAAGNPALSFFADALSQVLEDDLAQRYRLIGRQPAFRQMMIDVHVAVYVAVRSGDERRAMDAIDRHFDAIDLRLRTTESADER